MTKEEKQFIKKHGDLGAALLKQYRLEKAMEAMEDYYQGEFYSQEDFAKSFIRERADEMLPEESYLHYVLSRWCNWAHLGWELFVNDFKYVGVGNKIHVFSAF